MFWANKHSKLEYIKVCAFAFQNDENMDWEGRIKFIEKKKTLLFQIAFKEI